MAHRREAIDAWLESRSNKTLPMRALADVKRVEPQSPAPRRPGRVRRAGGSGTLIA